MLASVRTAINMKIFNYLAENEVPLSVSRLAELTKVDPVLLGMPLSRIL